MALPAYIFCIIKTNHAPLLICLQAALAFSAEELCSQVRKSFAELIPLMVSLC